MQLGLYENMKTFLRNRRQQQISLHPSSGSRAVSSEAASSSSVQLSRAEEYFSAAVTGAVAGFCTTPLDVIKTRIMIEV